ncbi:MAG TPA: methyltransferase domain-containing protein [Polyangiales bacterium]
MHPLPHWLDAPRLLGFPGFRLALGSDGLVTAEAQLSRADAADVAARLRGLGFAGHALHCEVTPALDRSVVRRARTADARRRRHTSEGFTRAGVRLDAEARYSLTPEALAFTLGEHAAGRRVLDCGCGAGGNAIGFARAGCEVVAVERDAARLSLARHNAAVYGVSERIRFVHGDALAVAADEPADVLFVDPPWGKGYDHVRTTVADLPLLEQLLPLRQRFAELWAKVPPSFDPGTLPNAEARALFGVAQGDAARVKFVWLSLKGA